MRTTYSFICAVLLLFSAFVTAQEKFTLPTLEEFEKLIPVPSNSGGFDLDEIEAALKGDGLEGWIHGSVKDYQQYVFTYRDPENFFRFINFSILSRFPSVKKQLETLNRHDRVLIKGRFNNRKNPQPHIRVKSLEVLEPFEAAKSFPHYKRQVKLPDDVLGKTELIGKVHAVLKQGEIFLIEYKDAVLPVVTDEPGLVKDLFRNDFIKLQYEVRKHPQAPAHLWLNTEAEKPVEVLDAMQSGHGQPIVVEGNLVLFPKSPQLKFDVFAIQQIHENGLKRNFTVINFNDFELFMKVLEKLGNIWTSDTSKPINGRNKLIKPSIRIRATGTKNVVDPNQANPQVILDSIEKIEQLEK